MLKAVYSLLTSFFLVSASVGGLETPEGAPAQCPMPPEQRLKNKGGSDGSGLCVFTSIAHSARWQGVEVLQDFRDWMTKHPGGGYPTKVDSMIEKICKERSVEKPRYIQVQNGDLDILIKACQTRRMPAITYSFSPSGRYSGGRISHMVSLIHADGKFWGILDNNYIEEIEWLSTEEFTKTFGGKSGWAVILLDAGPPPDPRN